MNQSVMPLMKNETVPGVLTFLSFLNAMTFAKTIIAKMICSDEFSSLSYGFTSEIITSINSMAFR